MRNANVPGASPQLFLGTQPHLVDAKGLCYSWVSDPAGMVNRVAPQTYVDREIALFITTEVEAAMVKRFPPPRRYYYIHDFALMSNYSSEARKILTDWGVSRFKEVERVILLMPAGPVFRLGASAASLALRVVGARMDLGTTFEAAAAECGLRPALP